MQCHPKSLPELLVNGNEWKHFQVPTTTAEIPTTTRCPNGPGCLGVPLKFSLSSDTFPESRLMCEEEGKEKEEEEEEEEEEREEEEIHNFAPDQDTMVDSGSGHLNTGFILEFFCEYDHWVVNLM